jgi:hypothetical protein
MASEPPSVGASLRVQEGSQAERGAGVVSNSKTRGHMSRKKLVDIAGWFGGLAMVPGNGSCSFAFIHCCYILIDFWSDIYLQ